MNKVLRFQYVSPEIFKQKLDEAAQVNARIVANIEKYDVKDLDGFELVLTRDGLSGFAIKPDGELTAVFSAVTGRGVALVSEAIQRGAHHLNAFDGYLTALYRRMGFVETGREANWTKNGPDVVFMEYIPGLNQIQRNLLEFRLKKIQ